MKQHLTARWAEKRTHAVQDDEKHTLCYSITTMIVLQKKNNKKKAREE